MDCFFRGEAAMTNSVLGTIDGDIVRLDKRPPLPSGCRVELTMQPLDSSKRRRAKVGETTGPAFQVPDQALAPLTSDELREWGLLAAQAIGGPFRFITVDKVFDDLGVDRLW
jgi:hypothetical protein